MKIIILLFLVFSDTIVYSQQYCMEDLPKINLNKSDSIFLKSNEDLLKKISFSIIDPQCQWAYYLRQSVNRLYLKKDSSTYYLNEALHKNLNGTCKYIAFSRTFFEIKYSEGKTEGFSCFYTSLPKINQLVIDSLCQNLYDSLAKKESIIKDSMLISEIIRRRDQKYRGTGEMEKQKILDQVNRDFIDSIYAIKKSIAGFDEDEIYQFSMVAHHSEDCDWVYKWTERFIELYNDGYKGNTLLTALFDRMFAPDGYCTEQDTQKRDFFMYMIRNKYPTYFESHKLNW